VVITSLENTAVGDHALQNNRTASRNTATGAAALNANTTGNRNTAIGVLALSKNTTGNTNIAVGDGAGQNVTTASNVICIGSGGANVSNSCYVGQVFGVTSSGGTAVFVNSNGQLATLTSSARFKEDVEPMDKASEALFALKPVSFRYKKEIEATGISQLGLVAEDVEKVSPDLVVRDKEGKPYSVRYDQVNAMLLNEFLKEHRKVEQQERKLAEQETTIAQLKSAVTKQEATAAEQRTEIAALTAGLQRVSAQVEINRTVPQMVVDAQ
jgi:uncharacterized coiled-coil protein SlyX